MPPRRKVARAAPPADQPHAEHVTGALREQSCGSFATPGQFELTSAADCCLLPIKAGPKGGPNLGRIDTCPHTFHFACIKKWSALETTCPQCKAVFARIDRICAATGDVLETVGLHVPAISLYQVSCESLFLWDHPDGEDGSDHAESPEQSAEAPPQPATIESILNDGALQLLVPKQLEVAATSKRRRKSVEITDALARTERNLKRMAVNEVCYAPMSVTYEAKPMPKPALRPDSEFKLQPVYEEDFIAK
ncbi:RING finger protein [Babesia caballi]|uniref:RING finger protein n=1 Tax=Babesia caballi TaxID=5871 RepID=A0AAV4LZ95_BABCB|nr:RING finger protein [Babesia caballi]